MNSGRLTTHVLDTMHGRPAAHLSIDLFHVHGDHVHHLASAVTNQDGRCAAPLLEGETFRVGTYELIFDVGNYYVAAGLDAADAFLSLVPVRFTVSDATAHYHVPLLVSPFGYSTYRGS